MDEVFKSEMHYGNDGVLTHKLTQPTENLILQRNAELRKNPGVLRDLGQGSQGGAFGRQVASIPMIMYDQAIKAGYEMNSKNSKHAGLETMRFLKSDLGKQCLVQG